MKKTLAGPWSFLIKPFLEVRSNERTKTLLMFFYFFLTVAVIYILKPVRSSLFLDRLGAKNLRFVYMGEGLFLFLVTWIYVELAKRMKKKIFYATVLGFFIACLVAFWALFRTHIPYLTAFFYIWVAAFSITMTTQFWTLANDIFNPIEAKRLFGFIISGGSLGGIFGGLLTGAVLRWMKTEDLLLMAAGLLGGCMLLLAVLWKKIPGSVSQSSVPAGDKKKNKVNAEEGTHHSVFRIFMGSSYLMMLAALVILSKMASTIIDNQFNGIVEVSVVGKEARTAFLGQFMAWLNTISFVMQFFFTSFFLRYLGVGFSLWVLPVGLGILSYASFADPVLLLGLLMKLFDGSVNYSVQQASKEVLYLPLSSPLRYRTKPVIDMLGFRLAKSLAGVYIFLVAPLLHLADDKLSLLILLLVPLWAVLVWQMKKSYSKLLLSHLLSRRQFNKATQSRRATDVMSLLYDEKSFENIKVFMSHHSAFARKLAATAYLVYHRGGANLKFARRVVNQMMHEEAIERASGYHFRKDARPHNIPFLDEIVGQDFRDGDKHYDSLEAYLKDNMESVLANIEHILTSPLKGLEMKRKALKILSLIPSQQTMDLLLNSLPLTEDHALRFVMGKTLAELHRKDPNLEINRGLVKKEIVREAEIYRRIRKILTVYMRNRKKAIRDEDYLGVKLKAIKQESLERIFQYLSLLYPSDVIQLIYDRVHRHLKIDPLRSHAVELLNNTVEPDLFGVIQGVMSEQEEVEIKNSDVIEILRGFIKSHDRWFSLAGIFLIAELDFDQRGTISPRFQTKKRIRQTLRQE